MLRQLVEKLRALDIRPLYAVRALVPAISDKLRIREFKRCRPVRHRVYQRAGERHRQQDQRGHARKDSAAGVREIDGRTAADAAVDDRARIVRVVIHHAAEPLIVLVGIPAPAAALGEPRLQFARFKLDAQHRDDNYRRREQNSKQRPDRIAV